MKHKKSLIATAVGSAMGLGATAANAQNVVFLDLQDFDNDGAVSGFSFVPAPFPDGINGNLFGFKNETGCKAASTSPICEPIAFDTGAIGTKVFATGFNFGGTGIFRPNTTGDMTANINNGAMSWSALNFGGIFGGQFYLGPDAGNIATVSTSVTALATCGGKFDPNTYDCFGIVATWTGNITSPGPFKDFTAQWRLEGVAATTTGTKGAIPVPAAAWLFGSGLVGLAGVARRRKAKKS